MFTKNNSQWKSYCHILKRSKEKCFVAANEFKCLWHHPHAFVLLSTKQKLSEQKSFMAL